MRYLLTIFFLISAITSSYSQVFGLDVSAKYWDVKSYSGYASRGGKFDIDMMYHFDVDKIVGPTVGLSYCHYLFSTDSHSQGQGFKHSETSGDGIGFTFAMRIRILKFKSESQETFLIPYFKVYTIPKYFNAGSNIDFLPEGGLGITGVSITPRFYYWRYGVNLFIASVEGKQAFGLGVTLGIGRKNFKKSNLPEQKLQPDNNQYD